MNPYIICRTIIENEIRHKVNSIDLFELINQIKEKYLSKVKDEKLDKLIENINIKGNIVLALKRLTKLVNKAEIIDSLHSIIFNYKKVPKKIENITVGDESFILGEFLKILQYIDNKPYFDQLLANDNETDPLIYINILNNITNMLDFFNLHVKQTKRKYKPSNLKIADKQKQILRNKFYIVIKEKCSDEFLKTYIPIFAAIPFFNRSSWNEKIEKFVRLLKAPKALETPHFFIPYYFEMVKYWSEYIKTSSSPYHIEYIFNYDKSIIENVDKLQYINYPPKKVKFVSDFIEQYKENFETIVEEIKESKEYKSKTFEKIRDKYGNGSSNFNFEAMLDSMKREEEKKQVSSSRKLKSTNKSSPRKQVTATKKQVSKITKQDSTGDKDRCIAIKKDGKRCNYKAKYGSYCGVHKGK